MFRAQLLEVELSHRPNAVADVVEDELDESPSPMTPNPRQLGLKLRNTSEPLLDHHDQQQCRLPIRPGPKGASERRNGGGGSPRNGIGNLVAGATHSRLVDGDPPRTSRPAGLWDRDVYSVAIPLQTGSGQRARAVENCTMSDFEQRSLPDPVLIHAYRAGSDGLPSSWYPAFGEDLRSKLPPSDAPRIQLAT